MNDGVLSSDDEQRSDFDLRQIFIDAYNAVLPFMEPDGSWSSMAHECMAMDTLTERFPELTGMRLFAVLSIITKVRASGRTPTD